MLKRDAIVSIFGKEGISAYLTDFTYDKGIDVILLSGDPKELIAIVKENNLKSIFYSFQYADSAEYLISDEDIEIDDDDPVTYTEAYAKYEKQFQNEKAKFNQKISKFDFDRPVLVHIYCILNGGQVGILQVDDWLYAIPDKNEVLERMRALRSEVQTAMVREEARRAEIESARQRKAIQEICRYLDMTDDWHVCTNHRLRESYCRKLACKFEEDHGVSVAWYDILPELEFRWKEYKTGK